MNLSDHAKKKKIRLFINPISFGPVNLSNYNYNYGIETETVFFGKDLKIVKFGKNAQPPIWFTVTGCARK